MKLKSVLISLFFILICPLFLFSQKVGINTTSPTSYFTVNQPAGQQISDGSAVMNIKYTGTNSGDVIGLDILSKPQQGFGTGAKIEGGETGAIINGGYVGIETHARPNLNQEGYGVYTDVTGTGGALYGFYALVQGLNNNSRTAVTGIAGGNAATNIGIFGSATEGTFNFAGYFNDGNVFVKNKIGIGLLEPIMSLDIFEDQAVARLSSDNTVNGSVLELRNSTTSPINYGAINFGPEAATPGQIAYLGSDNLTFRVNGSERMRINPSGLMGLGRTPATNRLEVEGNASKSTAGDWLANSDARLKKNIQPLDEAEMIEKLLALKGVTYEWNDDKTGSERPEGVQYGFTAQNIQEVFPTLVEEDAKGYLQTAYGTYDAMTIEAIRYLYLENQQLKQDIKEIRQLLGTTAGK